MTNLFDISETPKTIEATLIKRMDNFEHQLGTASNKPENLVKIIKEFNAFRDYVQEIFKLMRQQTYELSQLADSLEMRHRKKYHILSGVPEKADENTASIVTTILKNNLGLNDITASSFKVVHLLIYPSAILFGGKRLHLRAHPLSEFITKQRKAVYMEARKLFGMRNVWILDGNITINFPDGNRYKVLRKSRCSI
ncbi:unnamed protein product [Parnassius apollo]|uniref:(apollo) hypothetical protein n=1 Tax=Parnassius apollo TaxID=110799 RepID=A0A8S3Y7X0_PARAO|nr:unnamed protein product [Parnassius apollo]